ncbi:MAG: AraC family transcriptional regulator [Hyphomonadaceae bacterium]|nr:AraC family transcriptional regulator [Hyphomonadaceae bacterium]
MREIIRASAWGGFREVVEQLGGDADEILGAAHVDPADLNDLERYLPLRAFIDSQEIAAERLHRLDFGLILGSSQNLSVLGALSIAIASSATLREGIDICARYLHVHNPALTMTLAPVPRTTREFLDLHLDMRRPVRREQNSERMLASIHKALRQLGGPGYKPSQVWFLHAPISPMTAYRKTFGVTPLFNRPRMGISVERSFLDSWRSGASSQLRQIAETYLRQLSPPREKTFSIRVANVARSLLRGKECTPEQAARALGIHPRTLQRRLQSEGASFEKIKDEVRRATAESLLAQPSVSLSQIALMLDYADSSAFSRSCRRWFGEAPSIVRKRLLADKPLDNGGPRGSRLRSFEANLMGRSRRR